MVLRLLANMRSIVAIALKDINHIDEKQEGKEEYNKTKRIIEKIAGILCIIVSVGLAIAGAFLCYMAICYFTGAYNSTNIVNGVEIEINNAYHGKLPLEGCLLLLLASVLMLIFSIKLLKTPYLPNGEIKNKKE